MIVILSEASRRLILSRRSAFSISGSGRAVEESLFGVSKNGDVNKVGLLVQWHGAREPDVFSARD
jgi:hypothetical protein